MPYMTLDREALPELAKEIAAKGRRLVLPVRDDAKQARHRVLPGRHQELPPAELHPLVAGERGDRGVDALRIAGEVEPVGADRELQVDVRVIAATNRDLTRAVADGEFRQDLYYRLQVVTLQAPPLRERKDDIPELAACFLRQACEENHLRKTLDDRAIGQIARHDFPGNVRELKNLVERLVILTASSGAAGGAGSRGRVFIPNGFSGVS